MKVNFLLCLNVGLGLIDLGANRTHDALVLWCSEVTNPMQIMFSVLRGIRPDTSLESLPAEIPSRDTLVGLMTSGWTSNPDDRPSFLSESELGIRLQHSDRQAAAPSLSNKKQ